MAGLRVLAVLTAALALGLGALVPATAAAPGSTPPAADGMATAWVRAAHLVPGMGTAQISLVPFAGSASGDVTKPGVPAAPLSDGARVVAPAAGYGTAGDYAQVPQGLYTVQVRAAGAPATSAPMITGTLDAQADQAYTLAALGSKDAPRIQTYSDDLRPPKAGTASVRLLAAATRASAVTVTARSGPVVARDAEFGRPTGYAAVPDGPWTLDVATTTTSGGEAMRGASTTGKVELRSGGVYTLLVLDGASSGVKLLPLVDAQGVPTAPREGVQTGGGGAARAPRQGVDAGLALAGLGGLVLLGVGLHRRVALRPLTRGRR
ncbi:DUF4397 domain-containing protein [Phycicoccus sonneratiae]|uniref:DUF4397 domain-containing protein n=1 Tax=Phycicoccus sonneratiae TaxID=2807628 RepID=A0ABS2CFW8_9MICO|nr:DUF4397 domain-containing protein [Phycicoccus sonneraticus]MBM6398778.1 DUF4397 domain-containing protein [Phycicoccus sonneraticus]